MLRVLIIVLLMLQAADAGHAADQRDPRLSPWYSVTADGNVRVEVHLFWWSMCFSCQRAKEFLHDLDDTTPWLRVNTYEITESDANMRRFEAMATAAGVSAQYVPAVFICGKAIIDFDDAATTGTTIRRMAIACRAHANAMLAGSDAQLAASPRDGVTEIPLLGAIRLESYSLPVLTVVLAALDAFNPCAFFVLLFLLSLLVHARSRARMAIVGGVFVMVSGLAYFTLMAAWLNLFLLAGNVQLLTGLAGTIALIVGALNLKDFVALGAGVGLTMPAWAKARLFARMRGLLGASNLLVMLTGTVGLAAAANLYELLCTAGFPMVYTRALTLQNLGSLAYYLYLALYVGIYVLPLAVIVGVFTVTLGARKLTEREGRLLKLASGVMMLGLGAVLLLAPDLMTSPVVPVALIALAVAITAVAAKRPHRAA